MSQYIVSYSSLNIPGYILDGRWEDSNFCVKSRRKYTRYQEIKVDRFITMTHINISSGKNK